MFIYLICQPDIRFITPARLKGWCATVKCLFPQNVTSTPEISESRRKTEQSTRRHLVGAWQDFNVLLHVPVGICETLIKPFYAHEGKQN